MVNYKNAKIFKLRENDTGLTFIGGTTEKYLSKKICDMRWKLRNSEIKAGKTCYIHQIMKNNNFEITLLEAYPCNSKDELQARIFHYIREYKTGVEEI